MRTQISIILHTRQCTQETRKQKIIDTHSVRVRVRLLKTQIERMTDMEASVAILVCLAGYPEQG